ncbi:flagellar hook assembly protein FlgD [Sulfurirhabdus autotrophica]|uniref:Basal-body rod modification protein FlgD n=1 Tax=Sulfurirhabdus autotrophica TaxID=1706046 RepID=A0A4R3YF53_9PROT|nr:flagellar hook assembly protein FlgD [Sulfurirhabdus autotrophica]TCV90730.1 flagellar basal-body rod modification protein FlgD [Sulfurirhabdus autotrophica]
MSTVQDATSASQLFGVNNTSAVTKSAVDDGQTRFLKLLVTQMQNQDPLNPLDNAQVTSQLAQLSTVDGINKLNATVQALSASYAQGQTLQAASLIGRGVLAPGSSLALQSGMAIGGIDLSQPADSVVVTVNDLAGNAQQSIDLGPQNAGVVAFQWDGVKSDGSTAADGAYAFSVKAVQKGVSVVADQLAYGQVGSVTLGALGTALNTTGLGTVALSLIKQIL